MDGNSYLTWAIEVEIKLDGMWLNDERTKPDKAKVLHFLQHHLHPEYMTEDDPLVLWQSLNNRCNQQQSIVLSRAQQDWIVLRFQDFKSVAAYNSALHRIVSRLRLCGQKIADADMAEKTLSTLHPSNIVLHAWTQSTPSTLSW